MDYLWRTNRGRVSFQVLHEYYATATGKLKLQVGADVAQRDVLSLLAWQPRPTDGDMIQAAWAIERRFGFAFWDALIVSAAQDAGCRYLLTEDLQHGQDLDGLKVVNPFMTEPVATE